MKWAAVIAVAVAVAVAAVLAFAARGGKPQLGNGVAGVSRALSPYVTSRTRVWQATCSSGWKKPGRVDPVWACIFDTYGPSSRPRRYVVDGELTADGWKLNSEGRNQVPGPPLALLAPPR